MNQLTTVSSEGDQLLYVTLADGTLANVNLIYMAASQRWTMNILYNGIAINGVAVCVHPNLLRQFRRKIPFGIACTSSDGPDPFLLDDFTNNRCALFLLDEADLDLVEEAVLSQ